MSTLVPVCASLVNQFIIIIIIIVILERILVLEVFLEVFSSRKKYPYRRGEQEKTSGYLGLESHYHADHNCQTQQIDQ